MLYQCVWVCERLDKSLGDFEYKMYGPYSQLADYYDQHTHLLTHTHRQQQQVEIIEA